MIRKTYTPLAALAGLALAAGSAHGTLLVYEGFNYNPAFSDPTAEGAAQNRSSDFILDGKPDSFGGTDAIGLGEEWSQILTGGERDGHNMYLAEGSLSFGDLQTSGNHIRYNSNLGEDVYSRSISSSLTTTTTGEIWFSFLGNKLDTRGAAQEGLMIGNQSIGESQIGQDDATATGLRGFGIGSSSGNNWIAYGWAEGGTVSDGSFGVSAGATNLLIGRLTLALDGNDNHIFNGLHTFTAFYYDLDDGENVTADINNLVQIGSVDAEFDLADLDVLNITRRVNTAYDEIRIGTTLASVIEASGETVPEETFALTITPAEAPGTGYDLAWESQSGKLYNVRTSTDLAGAISTWDLVQGDIAATPPSNTLNVDSPDPKRFYAVEEFDAPPPPPLFSSDFEEDDGGFTVSTSEGSAWEWGTPDSDNGQPAPNDLVLTAGNSGINAWGTNLGIEDDGFYLNPTTTSLRSPVIDLTTATTADLSFAEATDFAAADSAEVYVISATDETEIAGPIHTSSTGAILTADWAIANGGDPIALPPAALGQPVRLEWRYTGSSPAFLGWYIDDVTVNAE